MNYEIEMYKTHVHIYIYIKNIKYKSKCLNFFFDVKYILWTLNVQRGELEIEWNFSVIQDVLQSLVVCVDTRIAKD